MYNICSVKKFDQTSYNTIQQDGQLSATFHTISKCSTRMCLARALDDFEHASVK